MASIERGFGAANRVNSASSTEGAVASAPSPATSFVSPSTPVSGVLGGLLSRRATNVSRGRAEDAAAGSAPRGVPPISQRIAADLMAMAGDSKPRKWNVANVREQWAKYDDGFIPDAAAAQEYADDLNEMEEKNPGSTDMSGFSSLRQTVARATTTAGHALGRRVTEATENVAATLNQLLRNKSVGFS